MGPADTGAPEPPVRTGRVLPAREGVHNRRTRTAPIPMAREALPVHPSERVAHRLRKPSNRRRTRQRQPALGRLGSAEVSGHFQPDGGGLPSATLMNSWMSSS